VNRATPELRALAGRLLKQTATLTPSAVEGSQAAFKVCESLRGPLSSLAGAAGFTALLSRAVVIAGAEVDWLRGVHVKSDGTLSGLAELDENLSPEEQSAGEIVLVANLLALLMTFIGEKLTMELLRDIWPRARFDSPTQASENDT
jgi:hypothetical protein